MAATLDIPHISAYLSFPQASLDSVLYEPTTELVNSLLVQVALKAREHEAIQSEKLKLEVELESAVHSADSKARVLKASAERAQKEVTELRQKFEAEETSRNQLQTQLRELKSSTSSADSETSTLKARLASLETSKRETVASLESRQAACDELALELSAKHQKTIELRSEVSKLEQSLQNANTAAFSAKSREQSLHQELESLKRTNEWLDKELKTRSAEHSKFRKERSTALAELQRVNEDSISNIDSLKRTEQTLRERLEDVTQKADEFLTKANEFRDEANKKEDMFRAELDTANRLGELMKESWNTEKQRHQDLSEQLEQLKDSSHEEMSRIEAELESEQQERISAEKRVGELEAIVERLEADAALAPATANQTEPQTPRLGGGSRRGTPGPDGTPSRFMSPTPGGIRGGISYTQLISDYHQAKSELEVTKRKNHKLSSTIDEMVRDMEAQQPQVLELQADHDRLEGDVLEMSSMVDSIGKERDEARKEAKKSERQVHGLVREGDVLRQQLRDLSAQIKVLLVEFHSHNGGREGFTPDERAKLERLAQGDLDDEESQIMTDTDRFISQHLTTFRNISELQEQNSKLLRLTRELGDRMEGEEAQAQRSQATQNQEELDELRQKYNRCRDEITSLTTQSKSYMQERDMFRRMLSHRGQLPADANLTSMFGQSTNTQPPATPSRSIVNGTDQSPASKEMADYAKLVKEMQQHFDNYRQESASDRSMLKDQLGDLTKKNTELRNDLSKKAGEVTIANERYEMLHGNLKMLKDENLELQKRSQAQSERAAIQEVRTQEATENLVESRALIESMRSEAANLKAEKDLWKSIENRLMEDNQTLIADRDRLNGLNSNLQNLLNEREHSDSEIRRKLQSQIEVMESELSAAKRKLGEEKEEHKRTVNRLDSETFHSQKRIDELLMSVSSTKEELAAVRTTRDHLQSRVDEMTIELRSAEERLEVLQQRPATTTNNSSQLVSSSVDGSTNREQELTLELSEMRRDLELTRGELASAKTQVEEYKAISQGSEEELRSFTETQEQYRTEMDQIIQERESKIRSLEQSVETLRGEIETLNAELSTLRTENAQHNHKLEDQKSEYEAKMTELKDQCDRLETTARYHQEDLKAQAKIANQAQQSYDEELQKHAEASKNLQEARKEYNELKLQIMDFQAREEAAQTQLAQSEESWNESKDRYERELAEIRERREDSNKQNKLLHQQLEDVNKQIASLQKSRRESSSGDNEDTTSTTPDTSLQELVRYLRKEKEIVDVQFDLSSQEARRLRQQLDHTQQQLEDTRLKLVQQRRAEEDSERQALNHKKLMDTIEELNLNRESNTTLRHEKNQLQTRLTENLKVVEELRSQLQPLQAKVIELEGLNESLQQDLRSAQEARARFEQRYLYVLHKSDSIDPEELARIKEQVTELEVERDVLQQTKKDLQAQVEGIPGQIKEREDALTKQHQESREKIISQAKDRNRKNTETIKERETALQITRQERDALQQQLQQSQSDLEQARVELATVRDSATKPQPTAGGNGEETEDGEIENEPAQANPQVAELQQSLEVSENKLSAAEAKVSELEAEVTTARTGLEQAEATIVSLQATLQETEARASQIQAEASHPSQAVDDNDSSAIENLQAELSQAQQEAETLRANALVQNSASNVQQDEGSPSIIEQITSQVDAIRTELTNQHEERVRQAEDKFVKRAENMKNQLSQKLQKNNAELKDKIEAAVLEATGRLNTEHAEEIDSLNKRHQSELDELRIITSSSEAPTQGPPKDSIHEIAETAAQTLDIVTSLSEAEIKELLSKNAYARKLVANSLTNNINKAKEQHERVLAEKMIEAEKKGKELESKKWAVKISMTENRANIAQGKLGVVEQAVKETPAKAVSEVWEVAKTFKPGAPVATAPARPASAASGSVTAQQTPASVLTPAGAPEPTPQTPTQPPSQPSSTQQSTSTSTQPAAPQASPQNPFAAAKSAANPFAQANPASGSSSQQHSGIKPPSSTSALAQSAHAPPSIQQPQATGANGASSIVATKRLPDQPLGAGRPSLGTGPGALRSISSGLPVPNAGRGSGIPQPGQQRGGAQGARGRGRGGGMRGGLPQVNTNAANQQGQNSVAGSPKNRQLSATAQQFVPKKRTAEDSGLESSQYAVGTEKRARGDNGN